MSADVTIDEVKRRAEVAGVRIREDRWEMVRALVADALRPIRRLYSRAIAALEPAGTFDASGSGAVDEATGAADHGDAPAHAPDDAVVAGEVDPVRSQNLVML